MNIIYSVLPCNSNTASKTHVYQSGNPQINSSCVYDNQTKEHNNRLVAFFGILLDWQIKEQNKVRNEIKKGQQEPASNNRNEIYDENQL